MNNNFDDYRNRNLWKRIKYSPRYNIIMHFFKEKVFWRILREIGWLLREIWNLILSPFYLIISTYRFIIRSIIKLHWWLTVRLPLIIKSIPTWPSRLYAYFYYGIRRLVWDQKYLRKKLFFIRTKNNFVKWLPIYYIILSCYDELQYHRDSIDYLNEWYVPIHLEGVDHLLSFTLAYFIFWWPTLYFIDIYYLYRNERRVILIAYICWWDYEYQQLLRHSMEMFMNHNEYISYIIVGVCCFFMNEAAEDKYMKWEVSIKHFSWQTDHFWFKMKEEKNAILKEKYQELYKEWKKYDKDYYRLMWF